MNDFYSKVVIRTPLQSLNSINKGLNFNEPLFKEGLYIGAYDLWQEIEKAHLNSKELDRKITNTCLKYWIRSCMRSTPFGTFAGTFVTNVGNETSLTIQERDHANMSVRLDMNYFSSLIDGISKSDSLKSELKYVLNNSIYSIEDSYRYAEYSLVHGFRIYELTKVAKTEYLASLLDFLGNTEKNINDLSAFLRERFNVSENEAKLYVSKLIDGQVLLSNIEAVYTGASPMKYLLDKIAAYNFDNNEVLNSLLSLERNLTQPQSGVSYFKDIKQQIKGISEVNSPDKNMFQVDLFLNAINPEIDQALIQGIVDQVNKLRVFCENHDHPDLSQFKEAFEKRYENREIPLTVALDVDQGIGYSFTLGKGSGSHDFVQGLYTRHDKKQVSNSYTPVHEFLINRLLSMKGDQQSALEISDEDIDRLMKVKGPLFDNTDKFIMGSLFKKNGELNKDNFLFELKSFGGTNAANLIGRFSSQSAEIEELIREIVENEESFYPDAIFAEVVHVPNPRVGNVIFRSNFRKYEIPFISNSGISQDNQIPIADLMISIQNDEVVLRSASMNKRVFPCLTTAHNFNQGNLPIYKFLCDLQLQKKSSYSWNWGPLSSREYLPRVAYKNIIIEPAKWRLNLSNVNAILSDKANAIEHLQAWRKEKEIPDLVVLKDTDNELLIDFNQENQIEILIDQLKKKKELTLKEFLANEENCIVKDENDNGYCSEMIIPLKKNEPIDSSKVNGSLFKSFSRGVQSKRFFEPGSEWLNIKLYGGNKKLEEVLGILFPKIKQLKEELFFEHFFFIRYFDPNTHLRLRFYNTDRDRLFSLQKQLFQILHPFIEKEILSKIQIDTYEREVERYGDNAIFPTEKLFGADSWTVLEFIDLLQGNEEKYRWLFAMRGIDSYLDDFGLNLANKHALLTGMADSFFKEHGGAKVLQKQLNSKYRGNQKFIASHMNFLNDVENEIEEIGILLNERSVEIRPIVTDIKMAMTESEFFNKVPSYIHMFVNRLFMSQQRKCELVVYHFLERFYTSKIAVGKKQYENK